MAVYAYGTLNEKGGAFRVCGVAPRVLTMMKLTKADTFLSIDASWEESLKALGS